MKYKKIIDIPILGGKLCITRIKSWKKVNKEYGFDLTNIMDACVIFKEENNISYNEIYFINKPSNAVIAHEAVHAVNNIFKSRGIKLDINNDELQAYLTEWVFEQVENYFEEYDI